MRAIGALRSLAGIGICPYDCAIQAMYYAPDIFNEYKSETVLAEIKRKSVHISISIVPSLAALDFNLTILLLVIGSSIFAACECLRQQGYKIPLVSHLTSQLSRNRDIGHFVISPVTLGLGALLALLLFPPTIANASIYILAFADSISTIMGKSFGRIRLPFTGGKSLEGSLACWITIYLILCTSQFSPGYALGAALLCTAVEALPLKDYDNVAIPVLSGFVIAACLF